MRPSLLALALVCGCAPVERSHDLPRTFGQAAEALRPDSAAADFPHFATTETIESIVSPGGLYRIHFTRAGVDAVPLDDADHNGTPDFVDTVASTYDRVLTLYGQLGYRRPPDDSAVTTGNGGDGLFDVYLVDFAHRADGAYRMDKCFAPEVGCAGYMVQENDFAGYGYPSLTQAIEILASHEMFHGVQAAYNPDEGSIAAEGSAVWATERFNPMLSDFEGFVSAYLERPDKTLAVDPTGPVPSFSYGSALFFEFLSEKFGDDIVRKLWEDCVPGARGVADPKWLPALDALLQREYASSFAAAFAEFARWNVFTGGRADPTRSYARGTGYDVVATEAKTFPADVSARMALASARYFQAPPDGRTHLVAEWVTNPPGEHVSVMLASVKSGKIAAVALSDTGRVELDADGASGIVFSAINGAHEGNSSTGFLCAGSPDEVEACKTSHGAGTPDAGPGETPQSVKVGCASTGTSWLGVMGLAVLMMRRRRSRPSTLAT